MQTRSSKTIPASGKAPADCSLAHFFLRILTDYCEPRGLPSATLMQVCGRRPEDVEDPDRRFPYLDFLKLCEHAAGALGDPLLGLHLGLQMKPKYLGPYGFALLSSGSVRELLVQASRYSVLAIDCGVNVFEECGDECIRYWRHTFGSEVPGSRYVDDLVMSSWAAMIGLISGRPDLAPRWVSFPYPAPRESATYEAIFRCPVRFGTADFAISFDRRYLELQLDQGHPEVRVSLNALCEQALARLEASREPGWLTSCRQLIAAALTSEVPTLSSIARRQDISAATLRSRLSKRDLSFRDLLEETRHELAVDYLANASLSLIDIAYLLGYSEQSAFQRAFKRRQGLTPGEYRRTTATTSS